ncbi:MAG: 23S rRNA (uracil(1939)-C(5))-methyltransferase RlmD [Deltaproteobacteria bacterium]|jgi:23S rRNA (uracil1939-C5)-methyltransferase|nr:23S rRNA (uracil(1939)-C(5))-methyltransferase RlmD [Deltaproteobacteria bacterium]
MPELIKDLEITGLVHGGRGIGRCDGKAVFVPMTAPGDRVVCRVVRSKSSYSEAELVAVVEPSAHRREPPCPYFGSCGGCQWQHLFYPSQCHWKEKIFFDQLLRGKVVSQECLVPIVPAPDEWHYRNRVQFKCHMTGKGLVTGFYRCGSHSVVEIKRCLLLPQQMQYVLDHLHKELPGAPCPECITQVDVACGDDGALRVLLHGLTKGRRQLQVWLQAFAQRHQINACLQSGHRHTIELVHGETDLTVIVDQPPIAMGYGPGGFAQVNPAQNRNLIAEVLAILDLQGNEKVLDLFCGMGNFSLPIARRAGWVTGIEDHAPSVAAAINNAHVNNLKNVEFRVADASTAFSRGNFDDLDLLVLDPPRSGSYHASREILKARPQRVLYISCDPATLVRDLQPLVHGGYRVVSSRPFDHFPQTWHVESLTLLERRSAVGCQT